MKCVMKISIIILLLNNFFPLRGQTVQEIEIMRNVVRTSPAVNNYEFAKHNHNELQMLFSGLFLFYKNVFSSQDGQSCSFLPSCSEYGILSVKNKGIIVGIISTFDRLMRCHGLAPELYTTDKKTGLLIDYP